MSEAQTDITDAELAQIERRSERCRSYTGAWPNGDSAVLIHEDVPRLVAALRGARKAQRRSRSALERIAYGGAEDWAHLKQVARAALPPPTSGDER